jgi:hypothetical protein
MPNRGGMNTAPHSASLIVPTPGTRVRGCAVTTITTTITTRTTRPVRPVVFA